MEIFLKEKKDEENGEETKRDYILRNGEKFELR